MIMPFTTPARAIPIVTSCLPCAPLTTGVAGAWAAKSQKEYDLDENGERIRLPSGRYKTHKVDLTGGNDKGNALLWRKAWADISNAYLERAGSPERIDHRSNAERGIGEIPTVPHGRGGLPDGEERYCHRERRTEPEYPKGKPPYTGNPSADWKAQRMDCRPVRKRGKPPRNSRNMALQIC